MKKYALIVSVVGIFVLYSLAIRHQASENVAIKPLSSPQTSTTGNTAATPNSSGSSPPTQNTASSSKYKDGSFTGDAADAFYGNVQIKVTIANGQITVVDFLQYPNTHSTSVEINQQAMPYLKQETIQAQSAHVNLITGATFTSQAFIQSLSSALTKAT